MEEMMGWIIQTTTKSTIAALLMGLGSTVPIAVPAHAASDSFCNSYANTAVSQHRKNKQLGCGFDGPRWQSNRGAHFIFCKAVSRGVAQTETDQRADDVSQCQEAKAGGRFQDNEVVTGGSENNTNDQGRFQNNEVIVNNDCKPSFSATAQQSHNDEWEATLLAIGTWQKRAKARHGTRFDDWRTAKNKDTSCGRDANNKFLCRAQASPCNG